LKTPVALFVFRRPHTTEQVFAEVARAKPPKLLVVANAPRDDEDEQAKSRATRAIIERVDWDCEVLKRYSETHINIKEQIGGGLNWVFEQVEEAIILEDDCVPHQSFFPFCDELLERYRYDERVMMIAGLNYLKEWKPEQQSYHFSHMAGTWGWASWSRAWKMFDLEMKWWPQVRDSGFLNEFLPNPRYRQFWQNIFQLTYEGKLNTWDYQWFLDCWTNHGLRIFPSVNLITNIGAGPGATNKFETNPFVNMPSAEMKFPLKHPEVMIPDYEADNRFLDMIADQPASLISHLKAKAARTFKRS
jgi:hypothetical protein